MRMPMTGATPRTATAMASGVGSPTLTRSE